MAFSGAFRAPFAKTFDAGLAAAAGNGLLNNLVAWWNGEAAWMQTAAEVRSALRDLVDATTIAAG